MNDAKLQYDKSFKKSVCPSQWCWHGLLVDHFHGGLFWGEGGSTCSTQTDIHHEHVPRGPACRRPHQQKAIKRGAQPPVFN